MVLILPKPEDKKGAFSRKIPFIFGFWYIHSRPTSNIKRLRGEGSMVPSHGTRGSGLWLVVVQKGLHPGPKGDGHPGVIR
jgi:hypothetical protein